MNKVLVGMWLLVMIIMVGCGGGGSTNSGGGGGGGQMHTTVSVSPTLATVALNGTQQFNAVASPSSAPQTFNWTVTGTTCNGSACGTVSASGLYTAPATLPGGMPPIVKVTATSSADATATPGNANVTLVSTQLNRVKGTYTLRFNGFNAVGAVLAVGNLVSDGNGHITSGAEDVSTSSGPLPTLTITGGSYTVGSDGRGGMTVNTSSGTYCYLFAVGSTTIDNPLFAQFDSTSTCTATGTGVGTHGTGVMNLATPPFSNAALKQPYVFELVGADANGKRVAYVGKIVADPTGNGNITSGSLDINDAGIPTSSSTVTGTYNVTSSGRATMTLNVAGLVNPLNFAFYVKDKDELHIISTDPVITNPRVVGFAESQDAKPAYDNGTFNGKSVFYLSGVDAGNSLEGDVSAGIVTTNGAGSLSGVVDRNDAGIPTTNAAFNGSYAASPAGSGRYTVSLNGVPSVMYAITVNKGLLLDLSTTSVFSGLMQPQTSTSFNAATINGTFIQTSLQVSTAAAQDQIAALVLNASTGNISGTMDETDGSESPNLPVVGAYTVNSTGRGTFDLTMPTTSHSVLYVLSASEFVVLDMNPSNQHPTVLRTER
jgi:hypothetical protein